MYDHLVPYTPASAVVRHGETITTSGVDKCQPFSKER